jgi:hypothetical protein
VRQALFLFCVRDVSSGIETITNVVAYLLPALDFWSRPCGHLKPSNVGGALAAIFWRPRLHEY